MGIPVGVAILGVLALFNGIGGIIEGLQLTGIVAFGPVQTGSGVFVTGVIAIVYGVLYLALAWAAWTLRAWAWLAGMLLGFLGLFNAVLVMFATGSVAHGLGVALLPAVVLWYLNTDHIRAVFVQGEDAHSRLGSGYDREMAEKILAERSTD